MIHSLTGLKSLAGRIHLNSKGWKSNRKFFVIESDDWGSNRMPSKMAFDTLKSQGIKVENCPYNRFDSIENNEDVTLLFNLLNKFKDIKGNPAKFTANYILANPDFDKIEASNFTEYYFEPFQTTYKNSKDSENVFDLIKKGIEEKFVFPQFHGREHLNVNYWMKQLKENHPEFRKAFAEKVWGLGPNIIKGQALNVQASWDMLDKNELNSKVSILKDGLKMFESAFGYKSESFIANNFIWPAEMNEHLKDMGVKYLQGMKFQKFPKYGSTQRVNLRHYLGEKNEYGQLYLIRNVDFEPSQVNNRELELRKSLNEISIAFLMNKPVILNTHRLNYSGGISKENRTENLILLSKLLKKVLEKWPETEFVSSTELGKEIENSVFK